MKSRVISITVFFMAIMIAVSFLFAVNDSKKNDPEYNGELIVSVNEVQQLMIKGETEKAQD